MFQNQQSSVLNESELALLISADKPQHSTLFPLYSMSKRHSTIKSCKVTSDIAAIILQLSASPLGSAVIITEDIETSEHCNSLLKCLKNRADITVFCVGKLPSMSFDLVAFIYCSHHAVLEDKINLWENRNIALLSQWKKTYRVGIINDTDVSPHPMQFSHLSNVQIYNAQQAVNDIVDLQLLIINLNTPGLRLIEMLQNLTAKSEKPFLLLYGDMQTNLSHAVYNLVNHRGFSILASFDQLPTVTQSEKILVTLFSKIYLKHWINAPAINLSAKGIYHVESNRVESVFFPYGLNKQQIVETQCPFKSRKIINVQSIFDWFPDGLKREDIDELITELGSDRTSFDLSLSQPQKIKINSQHFTLIVMARLNNFRIYWTIEDEKDFSIDMLMFLPISDVILSSSISNQLIDQPSLALLDFLQAAQSQHIQITAEMTQNTATVNALSLYGIETLLTDFN